MTNKKHETGAGGEDDVAGATGEGEATGAVEETAVTTAVAADEAQTGAATTLVVHKHGRLRSTLVGLLVLLSCLTLVITGVTIWTHYTVLNTNGYMKLVGPIGKDPQAIQALSSYVAAQVVTASDLQGRAQSALPTQAQFLAGPLTSYVQSFIDKQVTKVLSTPQAYDLWLGINRVTHQQLVGLLRGQNNYTYIQGNDVKLNLLPLVSQALVWLDSKLPGALSSKFSPPVIQPGTPASDSIQQMSLWAGKALPANFGQVTLLKNNALGPAQKAVKIFDGLVIALPIILALLIAGTILLSRRRRYTVMALGIGGAIALIVTYVIIKRASAAIVGSLQLGSRERGRAQRCQRFAQAARHHHHLGRRDRRHRRGRRLAHRAQGRADGDRRRRQEGRRGARRCAGLVVTYREVDRRAHPAPARPRPRSPSCSRCSTRGC